MRRIKVLAVFGVAALILGACGNDTSGEDASGSTTTEAGTSPGSSKKGDDAPKKDDSKKDDEAPKEDDSKKSGDRSADEQAYVDEMTAAFGESAGGDNSFPVDQMECFVGGMVDGVGVDNLKQAGLTPESVKSESSDADIEALSEGDRRVVAASFTDCVDLQEIFLASIEAQGEVVPQEMKDCFGDIDWNAMESEFAEMMVTGDDGEDSAAMAPLMGCMMMGLGDLDPSTTDGGTGG